MRGYLCRKAYDMADFIQDSIGYEGGKVHSFFATDEVSSVLLSSQIVSDLIVKWNTTSLCLSLYCMKDVIIRQLPKDSNHAKAYVIDQKDYDYDRIIKRSLFYLHSRSVKAIVINGAEHLFKKSDYSSVNQALSQVAVQEKVPVILVESYEVVCLIPTDHGIIRSCRAKGL